MPENISTIAQRSMLNAQRHKRALHALSHFILTILQGILDIVLYNLSFAFIPLTFEVRVFLSGTMTACFVFGRLYGFRNMELWDETIYILKASLLDILVNVLYLYVNKFTVSFSAVIICSSLFIPLTIAGRYLFRRALFRLGLLSKSVIIIGAGEAGEIFARNITSSPFTIRRVLGFLDDDPAKQGLSVSGGPVLGKLEDFTALQEKLCADEAVIAMPTVSRKRLAEILNMLEERVPRVLYIPDMYMLTTSTASIRNIDGMPVISSSQGLLSPVNVFIKSVIDYVGAIIALVIFSPVMLWAAWRIKREDGGPVFFTQPRIGRGLKPFRMCKFRTMIPNAAEVLEELLSKDENLRAEFKRDFKLKNDPRITKVGHILRNNSFDELPQLFNILRGEMSLVGPRPIEPKEVNDYYSPSEAQTMFSTRPGITGMWQVSGRSELDVESRKGMNLYYVHNWSVWLDIAILLKTPLAVLSSKGAY